MVLFLFLEFGALKMFFMLSVCFSLRGGIVLTHSSGSILRKFGIMGELKVRDWVKSGLFALANGLMAGFARTLHVLAIIIFFLVLIEIGYLTYWTSGQATMVKEVFVSIALLASTIPIAINAAIISGSAFLKKFAGIVFVICVALVIIRALWYRADKANEPDDTEESEQTDDPDDDEGLMDDGILLRIAAIASGIVALIVVIAMLCN